MTLGVITGSIIGRTGATLMARLTGNLGTPVTQASLSSISWSLANITAGTVAGSGTFAIASTIFDALQAQDPRWTADAIGYNFLATLADTLFPVTVLAASPSQPPQPVLYQADIAFVPVTGSRFTVVYELYVSPVFA